MECDSGVFIALALCAWYRRVALGVPLLGT
jgi:hypothetical protein